MAKLPRLTAKQIIAVLEKVGFALTRQSGSHMILLPASARPCRSIPQKHFTRKF